MLRCESRYEIEVADVISRLVDDSDQNLLAVHHYEATGTVDVTVRLPETATIAERERILGALEDYEREHDYAIVTNPTFVLGGMAEV